MSKKKPQMSNFGAQKTHFFGAKSSSILPKLKRNLKGKIKYCLKIETKRYVFL